MSISVKVFRDDYKTLMEFVENNGYRWLNGKEPTEVQLFADECYLAIILNDVIKEITWTYEEELPYESCDYSVESFMEKYAVLKDSNVKNPISAREMFEELGYHYSINEDYIYYGKGECWGDDCEYYGITFWLKDKTFDTQYEYESMQIDMATYKAIRKQLEELGWI